RLPESFDADCLGSGGGFFSRRLSLSGLCREWVPEDQNQCRGTAKPQPRACSSPPQSPVRRRLRAPLLLPAYGFTLNGQGRLFAVCLRSAERVLSVGRGTGCISRHLHDDAAGFRVFGIHLLTAAVFTSQADIHIAGNRDRAFDTERIPVGRV